MSSPQTSLYGLLNAAEARKPKLSQHTRPRDASRLKRCSPPSICQRSHAQPWTGMPCAPAIPLAPGESAGLPGGRGRGADGPGPDVTLATGQAAVAYTGGCSQTVPTRWSWKIRRRSTPPRSRSWRPVAPGENVIQGRTCALAKLSSQPGALLRPQDIGGLLALGLHPGQGALSSARGYRIDG